MRLNVCQLPKLPPEVWLYIAKFNVNQYFPKLEFTTTRAGLNELEPYYAGHEAAVEAYHNDNIDMQKNRHHLLLYSSGLTIVRH